MPATAAASWDGTNISRAATPSSAFTIGPGQSALVVFEFFAPIGRGTVAANASLTLTYLGVVVQSSVAPTHPALGKAAGWRVAAINWSLGSLYDVIEGVFQVTASLLDRNGSSIWSEPFYVNAKAPYSLESGFVVVLLLLFVVEAYYIGSAFRTARREGRPGTPPPSTGPAAGPSAPTTVTAPASGSGSEGSATGTNGPDSSARPPSGGPS